MNEKASRRISTTLLAVVVAVIFAAGLVACSRFGAADSNGPRPNVVLITLDTTRADHLHCYGYPKSTSPNIDAFAQEATLFQNAICTAAVTPVSHASILTGLYPYSHGLRVLHGVEDNRLPKKEKMLSEVLKKAGYETGAFISAFPAGSYFGLNQGFDTFDEEFLDQPVGRIVTSQGLVNTGKNQRTAGDTTDRALAWLAKVEQPFCLWLHYFDPHDPHLLPPPEYMSQFTRLYSSTREQLLGIYDIEIQYMDHHIGRVIQALRDAGRLDDTIVVIVSDHGEGLGDHGWWTHGIVYQEQILAPLIMRAPGMPAGRRVDHLVRTIDIMPTILDLAGIDASKVPAMDGESLAAMLQGDVEDPGLTAYADSINMLTYSSPTGQDKKDEMLFAVIDGEWKYIHHLLREEEGELYNLAEDPKELNNLFLSHRDQVKRLLEDLMARSAIPANQLGGGDAPPELIERLRSLGYIK